MCLVLFNSISMTMTYENMTLSSLNILLGPMCRLFVMCYIMTHASITVQGTNPRGVFTMITTDSGDPVCAPDPPSKMLLAIESNIQCCLECLTDTDCIAVNYFEGGRMCALFNSLAQPINCTSVPGSLCSLCVWSFLFSICIRVPSIPSVI